MRLFIWIGSEKYGTSANEKNQMIQTNKGSKDLAKINLNWRSAIGSSGPVSTAAKVIFCTGYVPNQSILFELWGFSRCGIMSIQSPFLKQFIIDYSHGKSENDMNHVKESN